MNTKTKYRKRSLQGHNAERLKYISGLLKEHRLWMGYSRVEMEQFGISRAVIQRAESSDPANLTLKTLLEIADVYQVSPEELFQGVE
jgi:transcriptional regulator with XRE-family HTH domain